MTIFRRLAEVANDVRDEWEEKSIFPFEPSFDWCFTMAARRERILVINRKKTSSLQHSASDYRLLISTITWSGKSMGKLAREMYTIIDDKLYRFAYRLFAVLYWIGWSMYIFCEFSFFIHRVQVLLAFDAPLASLLCSTMNKHHFCYMTWMLIVTFSSCQRASDCNGKKISRMTKDLERKYSIFLIL